MFIQKLSIYGHLINTILISVRKSEEVTRYKMFIEGVKINVCRIDT